MLLNTLKARDGNGRHRICVMVPIWQRFVMPTVPFNQPKVFVFHPWLIALSVFITPRKNRCCEY